MSEICPFNRLSTLSGLRKAEKYGNMANILVLSIFFALSRKNFYCPCANICIYLHMLRGSVFYVRKTSLHTPMWKYSDFELDGSANILRISE